MAKRYVPVLAKTPWKIPPITNNGRKMNKLEARYRDHLELLKRAGEILDYAYESITFRLATNTTYTPDFIVITPQCIEFHEVKGFWRDDARAKWKMTAEKFPWFRFLAIQWRNREWIVEEYA